MARCVENSVTTNLLHDDDDVEDMDDDDVEAV